MKIIAFTLTFFIIQFGYGIAQNVAYKHNIDEMSKNLKMEISSDNSLYEQRDTIFIKYKITNISKTNQTIILKDYWGFPKGMTISIRNQKDSSICKFPTKHILSSQLYTERQWKEFERTIEPGKSIAGIVKLQEIPVFIDEIKDGMLPIDCYNICLSFLGLTSNKLIINIEKYPF
ncbi:MAG: hypothetical protein PHV20_06165 [Bacteroidales bacterium]|nr:hypothetical protein [Bacteroidales bacterium]